MCTKGNQWWLYCIEATFIVIGDRGQLSVNSCNQCEKKQQQNVVVASERDFIVILCVRFC